MSYHRYKVVCDGDLVATCQTLRDAKRVVRIWSNNIPGTDYVIIDVDTGDIISPEEEHAS